MSNRKRFVVAMAVLAGLAIPIVVGCSVLKYQFCITNLTSYNLKEVNIVPEGTASWGANQLSSPILAGAEQDIPGFSPGTYWVRAIFDVVDPCTNGFCVNTGKSFQETECQLNEVLVYSFDLPAITTTNLCITYDVRTSTCTEIYATASFAI